MWNGPGRRTGLYEPEVGNTPTTNTFVWTWASFCFTFLAFGMVLFIYEFWLNHPDDAPMDPVLAKFGTLTESQRKVGKYFLVVAAVLLLQIAAGSIMAHAYYDRRSFYGVALQSILPFNFLRDIHIQSRRSSGSVSPGLVQDFFWHLPSPGGARHAVSVSWWICCSGSRCSLSQGH